MEAYQGRVSRAPMAMSYPRGLLFRLATAGTLQLHDSAARLHDLGDELGSGHDPQLPEHGRDLVRDRAYGAAPLRRDLRVPQTFQDVAHDRPFGRAQLQRHLYA
jgi:hypothetical protein